ncbi:MAG: ABC transporter permease [Faecousia sp.]
MIRISKRNSISLGKSVLIRGIAIFLSLIATAIVILAIVGLNPIDVYVSMAKGTFGDPFNLFGKRFQYFLRDMMILTCIAIGLAPAFKMRFWNVGAEGQMLVGAIGAMFFMRNFAGKMPNVLLFVCMIAAALLLGGIWGLIPGFFKAKWNTNETLFTLMMNYIAIRFTAYCVAKWENPFGSNTVGIVNSDTKTGWIGNLLSKGYNGDYLWTVLIVLALCTAMWAYLRYSKQGYEIAVVGDSENTARYAGIRVNRVYMRTMAISGAVCGFAGFLAVSAVSHTISISTAGGRGFTAIIVAWLAKMNPFVMLLISALLTFLSKGAIQIATDFQLNEYASEIISGIVLFFILGSEFFINYKLKLRGSHKEG